MEIIRPRQQECFSTLVGRAGVAASNSHQARYEGRLGRAGETAFETSCSLNQFIVRWPGHHQFPDNRLVWPAIWSKRGLTASLKKFGPTCGVTLQAELVSLAFSSRMGHQN